jgi:RimJ/RimL family protein N-acetyltransferase
MLSLLEPASYARAASLFEGMEYHLAVMTVLAGKTPGKIYADDPASPQTAVLIPANRHRIYVAGSSANTEVNEAIRALFAQELATQAGSSEVSNVYECMVYYPSDDWKHALGLILKGQETFTGWRQFHRLGEQRLEWRKQLPESLVIRQIDGALLADLTLQNRERMIEEIHSESPSIEHFLHHNFGFCAQDGRVLVGWCMAEYHYQDRYELGVETVEVYQRRGIATLTASAMIEHAFAEGAIEIGWHCWANNTASVATARKLGFEKSTDYPVCYCLYRRGNA